MNENEEVISLLLQCKNYVEQSEEKIDSEFGLYRNVQKIISDNDMPKIYDDINALIKKLTEKP